MSVVEFFSQPVWHRLSLTLLHFTWQGATVGLLACAAVRLLKLKRGNPPLHSLSAGICCHDGLSAGYFRGSRRPGAPGGRCTRINTE